MASSALAEKSTAVGELTVTAYTIPTDAPEGDGTMAWESTTMIVVQVSCDGVLGTGWTYGSPVCAELIKGKLTDVVVGHNALDVTGASDTMIKAVRNIGRPGVAGQAISAIDVALWDLKARLLGLPLHRLLGAVRDAVPVYGSGGFTTYDERQLREQLLRWTQRRDIPRVKIKIGESWGTCLDRDLARLRQAREMVGDAVELYVDANGGYTRKQAVRLMADAAELDVRWFEEPVSSDDLDGLRVVAEAVDADVTAGEYGYDLIYFRRMCQAGAVDCLQADVSRCGGITEWLRVAAVAAAYNLEISAHCAPHLHLHAGAATRNLRHLEYFHDHARIEQMAFDGTVSPQGGAMRPDPGAPGHGLTLRAGDIDKYRTS